MKILKEVGDEFKNLLSVSDVTFFGLQNERFLKYINEIYDKSSFWRLYLKENGILSKNDLPKSVEDICKLPILTKRELLSWTKSGEKFGDVSSSIYSSGTLNNPLRVDYSKKSVKTGWGDLGLRALVLMGINPEDKGIMLTSFDENTGESHSSHVNTLALKNILGESLIDQPITRPLNESLDKIVSEKVKWIGTVPIFYNSSVRRAEERGIDLLSLGVKTLFYGGVSYPEDQRGVVSDAYNAEVLAFYPSTELCSAGTQISKRVDYLDLNDGEYILFSDWILFEFLDEDGNPVKEGEVGRVVATPMFMDSMPFVRYEIGDEVRFLGYKNNFPIVSDVKRSGSMSFSNALFHYSEVEEMKKFLCEKTNLPLNFVQVAKVLGEKDVEIPIIRIESRVPLTSEEKQTLKEYAIEAFRKNEAVSVMVDRGIHGGVHYPVVEFYDNRKLVPEGAFKPKLISDETALWSSYSFMQDKVTEHMSITRELADYSVDGLRDSKEVADLACGAGYYSSRLARAGMNVDGVDLNPAMIHYAKKRFDDMGLSHKGKFHNRKAEDTGLESHSKDGVHLTNILCHVENPDDILMEARRILNHGGKLSLGEPSRDFTMENLEKLKEISNKDVLGNPQIESYYNAFVDQNKKMTRDIKSLYSLDEMKKKLNSMGFDILDTKPTYVGTAYHILSQIFKRANFRKSIVGMDSRFKRVADRHYNNESLFFNFNERTVLPSLKVVDTLKRFVESGSFTRYSGVSNLYEKIADYSGVLESEVMITNGSYHAIDIICRALLSKGDKVIIPKPTFPAFEYCAKLQEAEICEACYDSYGGFPLDDVISSIDDKTKMVVICNPSNPLGTSVLKSDIEKILNVSRNVAVLVDEAYFEYSGITCADLVNKYPNLIIVRTFSKAFGLAGLRIGYVISNELNISELVKLKSSFDVNIVSQLAASAALDDVCYMKDYVSEVMYKSKPMLEYFFIDNSIKFYPSSGNFVFVKVDNPEDVCKELEKRGVYVSVQKSGEFGSGIRVSLGDYEYTKKFVEKYRDLLASC
jgi:histidinol-phosphate aminotransferase